MSAIETTKMTSRGQVVIPEETRKRLGLKAGDKFLVMGDKDVVILKTLISPSLNEFDDLIKKARKQAKAAGLKRENITKATIKAREQTRESCTRYKCAGLRDFLLGSSV